MATTHTTSGLRLEDSDAERISQIERIIGHAIPPPGSATLCEDCYISPRLADEIRSWSEHIHDRV